MDQSKRPELDDIDLLVGVALELRFAKASQLELISSELHFAMFARTQKSLVVFGGERGIGVKYSSFYDEQADFVLAAVESLKGKLVADKGLFRCTLEEFTAVGATYTEAAMRALIKYQESPVRRHDEEQE